MIRHIFLSAILLSSIASLNAQVPAPLSVEEQERLGREIVDELTTAVPNENSKFRGILRVSKKDKKTNDVPVICNVVVTNGGWATIYETIPTETTPKEKLVVKRSPKGANEYQYAKAPSAWAELPPLKKLTPAEAMIPLAGSDFWITDLGLDFLHWPVQRRIKGEMRLGQACHVLESQNPKGGKITRVQSWIDKDTGGILIAEAFDARGEKVKHFSLSGSSFKKVDGQWQLEKMEIRDVKSGSKTLLEFDLSSK